MSLKRINKELSDLGRYVTQLYHFYIQMMETGAKSLVQYGSSMR